MTCIVTFTLIIANQHFSITRRLSGTYEGMSGSYYMVNFESSVPELNKPVRVLKGQCVKG